jgi:hypothetical protein
VPNQSKRKGEKMIYGRAIVARSGMEVAEDAVVV